MGLKKSIDTPVKNYIGLAVFALLVTQLFPIVVDAIVNLGQAMAAQDVPFASFFTSSGIVGLLLAIGIFYGVWKYLQKVGN